MTSTMTSTATNAVGAGDFRAVRPAKDEHVPYYSRYVDRVPQGDFLATLSRQLEETGRLLASVAEERGGFRYAPDKWSVKQALGHMADTERVFAYRALRIARGDATPLAGFEQDDYVRGADFDARTVADLRDELAHVRRATIALFRPLNATALGRRGTANGDAITVRALGYIIAGHELHHLEVLRTSYGVGAASARA